MHLTCDIGLTVFNYVDILILFLNYLLYWF